MFPKTALAVETYPVHLDEAVSLQDQIKRGNFAYVNKLYTPEKFQLSITGLREIVFVDPRGPVSSEEMIKRLKAKGFVPATLDDALAIGNQHPDIQKRNSLVFLGTVFRDPFGFRRIPVLSIWNGGREIDLRRFGSDWGDDCRFAAVRES